MKEYIIELSDDENTLSILVKAYNLHELVRCKDCKHYNSKPDSHGDKCDKIHWSRNDDWFCADGKRRS